nr:GDCCVxC domain-containing (seleno)protein [uncultured Sphingomonas sp.]
MSEASIVHESILTCPNCGVSKSETMPTNACWFFYDCTGCRKMLRPLPGDCCVFCSYGTVKCPPIQQGDGCKSC